MYAVVLRYKETYRQIRSFNNTETRETGTVVFCVSATDAKTLAADHLEKGPYCFAAMYEIPDARFHLMERDTFGDRVA